VGIQHQPAPISGFLSQAGGSASNPNHVIDLGLSRSVPHHWDCSYTGFTREKARVLTSFLRIGQFAGVSGCISSWLTILSDDPVTRS
jgi:hypothetical protein